MEVRIDASGLRMDFILQLKCLVRYCYRITLVEEAQPKLGKKEKEEQETHIRKMKNTNPH